MRAANASGTDQKHSLETIQWLRFLAAWVVVYQHFQNNYRIAGYSYYFGGDARFFNEIWTGAFAVQLFFVISGFLMCLQVRTHMMGAGRFFAKRIIRVTPAYWVWSFVIILVLELVPAAFADEWNWSNTIFSLFYLPSSNPDGAVLPLLAQGWSLNIEMGCYVVLALCMALVSRFALIICGTLLVVLPLIWPVPFTYLSPMTGAMLIAFVAGIVLGELYARFGEAANAKRLVLGLVLLAAYFYWPLEQISNLHAWLVVAIALCFEPWVARLNWKLPRYLGDISYSTYLGHYIVIRLCLYFLPVPTSIATELLLQVVVFTLTFIASQLSYHFVELPSSKALSARFLKRKA